MAGPRLALDALIAIPLGAGSFQGTARRSMATAVLVVVGLAFLCAVLARSAWLGDDCYFSLRSAYNLAHGHGLRFNVAERVQAFTNPLWTLLSVPIFLLGLNEYLGMLALSLAVTLASAWVLLRHLAPHWGAALLALALLCCSKAFVDYGSSGLESPLLYLLYLGFLARWTRDTRPEDHPLLLGLLAALLACTRLDTILLVAPHLALVLYRRPRLGSVAWLALGMLPLLAWECFALVYYGSPFPNTAVAKLSTDSLDRGELLHRGYCYIADTLPWDRVTLPIILVGLLVAFARPRLRSLPTALGALAYLLYVIWIGGDFMLGRFLVLPFLAAVVIVVRRPLWRRSMACLPAVALVLAAGLSVPASPLRTDATYANTGDMAPASRRYEAIDERWWYYRSTGLLARLRRAEFPRRTEIRQPDRDTIVLVGAGRAAFVGGPLMHAVQLNGLSDPLLARMPPKHDGQERAGHVIRIVPSGYQDTLTSGENRLEHVMVARLWNDIRIVTRGPLWSSERWAAMWRLNTGHYGHLRWREIEPDGPWS